MPPSTTKHKEQMPSMTKHMEQVPSMTKHMEQEAESRTRRRRCTGPARVASAHAAGAPMQMEDLHSLLEKEEKFSAPTARTCKNAEKFAAPTARTCENADCAGCADM
jgi:hypothetical protein